MSREQQQERAQASKDGVKEQSTIRIDTETGEAMVVGQLALAVGNSLAIYFVAPPNRQDQKVT